jgi:NAD-dependent deacetylase
MSVYSQASELLKSARRVCAFTGSGISVESGIPPFRGKDGIYSKYDSRYFDLSYFLSEPENCWISLKQIFFDHLGKSEPNYAHRALAELERRGIVKTVITQNIDNLHQKAGSREVYEFHGNSQNLICLDCGKKIGVEEADLEILPPRCDYCCGILKPDFVFFGEQIPESAYTRSVYESQASDVFFVIGTTGEVMPAAMTPHIAKRNGAKIIEINPNPSNFTNIITDIFIREKACAGMEGIMEALGLSKSLGIRDFR